MDLNHRPPGPEPGALARLRYAPTEALRRKKRSKHNHQISIAPRIRPDRQFASYPSAVCSAFVCGHVGNNEAAGKLVPGGRNIKLQMLELELVAQCELHDARIG